MKIINVSADNITIVGYKAQSKWQVLHDKLATGEINNNVRRIRAKFPYEWSYIVSNSIFVQESNAKDRTNVRIEFNPNNIDEQEEKLLFNYLSCIKYAKLSRLDIAIDLGNIDINDLDIVDPNNRKHHVYYDKKGKIESYYIGTRNSDLFFRIYDKALEQNSKMRKVKKEYKNWWRIEAQLSGDFLAHADYKQMKIPNVFDTIKLYKKENILKDITDIRERAMLHYLIEHPNELAELNKNTRTKYKKKIADLKSATQKEIKLSEIFKGEDNNTKYHITESIKKYFKPTLINNIIK